MEAFKAIFVDHAMTWVIGLFFTCITFLLNKLVNALVHTQEKRRETIQAESAEQEKMKIGLLALLRFRINRLCSHIKKQGYMTSDERYDLVDIFSAYESLGGNGKTKMVYDYIMEKYDINDPEVAET